MLTPQLDHDAISVQMCFDADLSETEADALLTRIDGRYRSIIDAQAAEIERLKGVGHGFIDELKHQGQENGRLREVLDSIRQYGSDTLSGRANGEPFDAAYLRSGVREMTRRARVALQEISHDQ